ncbi:MAG: hypothetical protein ACI85O_002972, partial [Saprospiraceae bacterium]
FFICLTAMTLLAQDGIGKVVVGNSDNGGAVMVKWVVPALIAEEGFKVYRKENNGEFILQNVELIKKMDKIDIPADERDDAIDALEDMVESDNFTSKDNMAALILIVKFVESNSIARWLGLFYNDKNVVPGRSYEYKVTEMQKGTEVPVGISPMIISGIHKQISGLKNPSSKMNPKYEKEFRFSWTAEEDRYFGVNTYRKTGDGIFLQENAHIILPSKIPNKDGIMVFPDFFYNTSDHNYGIEYTYQLRPVDFFGREGKPSKDFKFIVIDKTPVPPPVDVAATQMNSEQILITWAAPPTDKIKGYNVVFSSQTEGEFTRLNEQLLPPTATEIIFNVPDWGDYYFRVEAVNSVDIPSPSGLAALSVLDDIPPVVVTDFTAEASEGFIDLKWNANTEKDLLGYVIFRSVNGDDEHYERITTDPLTRAKFRNELDKRYKNEFFYKVAAVDKSYNMSALSERASATMPDVTAPEMPTVFKVELTTEGNNVQWFPSLGDDLKGYEIYRCNGEDTTKCEVISKDLIAPNINEYLDADAEKGINIGYKVLAEDLAGNRSATSNIFIVKTKKDEIEGKAIARVKANHNARQKANIVKWNKPKPAEVKGTMVYRKMGEGRYVPISGLLKIEDEYQDKKIAVGNIYTYQVRTYYKNGTIAKSEGASAEVK